MYRIMKKRTYEKPTVKVVELQHRTMILAGSVDATRSGYGTAEELEWE